MSTPDDKSHPQASDDSFKTAAVFSGVRWTSAGQVVLESIRVVVSIVLAWLLSPADFGLVSMAMVVTGFLVVIQYLGTSGVVIQRKELPNRLLSSLFWLNVGFGLILTIGLMAAAHPMAMLYHRADVAPIIRVLAISFVITAIGAVPTALLNRRMRFDLIAKIGFLAAVLQGISGIGLAYAGYGPWALVYSTLVNSVVSTIGYWILVRWMPTFEFDWPSIRDNMKMMLNLTFGNLVSYLVNDADKFIIGRWLGDVSLGYYTMATRFCLYPPGTIVPIVTRVLYPTYSRLQDDDAGLQKILLRASGGIAFITMPLMIGLMLLASPFIHTILSSKWDSAIVLVAFLAPVGILQSISAGSNGVMLAKDKPHWIFWVAVIKGGGTIVALMAGIPWGLMGVAIAYLIVSVPLSAIGFIVAGRLIHMPVWRPVWELRPYVVGTGVMAAVVLAVRFLLVQVGAPMPIQFITGTIVGAITYIWVMLASRPPAVMDFVRLLPAWISRFLPKSITAGSQA